MNVYHSKTIPVCPTLAKPSSNSLNDNALAPPDTRSLRRTKRFSLEAIQSRGAMPSICIGISSADDRA